VNKRIAFINPKGQQTRDPESARILGTMINSKSYRQACTGFGLSLLILAALTPEDWEQELIDENYQEIAFDRPYGLVAVTANTQQATRAYQIGEEFGRRGVPAVLGGIHATVLPEEAKEHFRSVAIGEAENIWPRVLKDWEKNGLQPFYRCEAAADLSVSPSPRYELLDRERYNTIWVQATRGCPHDCSFCVASKIFGNRYQVRPIDRVVRDIETVKALWKSPNISFADDNMFVERQYARDLIRELRGLNIRYFVPSDISIAEDDELLKALRDSNCGMIFIGFESVTTAALRGINKDRSKYRYLTRYSSLIQKIQAMGIGVYGAFIIGFDQDTPETLERLGDFITSNHLYASQITILTPYPGSRVREELAAEGRLLAEDWSHYNCTEVTFLPRQLSLEQLQQTYNRLHQRVYGPEQLKRSSRYFIDIFKSLE
jgi:radical SAM superfamily enzyme YgiQ (UPF0313 family)